MVSRTTQLSRPPPRYEVALSRLTHLTLAHSRLTQIPALSEEEAEELQLCHGLQVAYLHDNAIERIEGLDFAHSLTSAPPSSIRPP